MDEAFNLLRLTLSPGIRREASVREILGHNWSRFYVSVSKSDRLHHVDIFQFSFIKLGNIL